MLQRLFHLAWFRFAIGFGLPTVAVIGAIPVLNNSHAEILGMPLLLAWIVLWMPLTTLALSLCWFFNDRHAPETDA